VQGTARATRATLRLFDNNLVMEGTSRGGGGGRRESENRERPVESSSE